MQLSVTRCRALLTLPLALALLLLGSTRGVAAAELETEAQCIQVLQSDASLADKDAACARLKFIGTPQSIAALAGLLTDEQLSHSARYALEPMSSPEAGRSLIEALPKTSGLTKAGIITSLGVRREAAAVPALHPALTDSDAAVATAAATALGDIATPEATAALQAALNSPAGPVQTAVVDATLRCANRLLAAGDQKQALAIFHRLYSGQTNEGVRVAAYRGWLLASGTKAVALATQAITGQPGPAQTAALQLVHDLKVPDATKAFAKVLPRVDANLQVALINGLAQRNDTAAGPAIAALVASASAEVRLAALTALGVLGDDSIAPVLAEAAASSAGAEQAAARESLVQLNRGEPAQKLLAALPAAKPAVQAEIARALGARSDSVAIPKLLDLARHDSGSARTAALSALAQLVDQAQLGSLVQVVVEAGNPAARAQAAEALNAACQHVQSKHGRVELEPLIDGLTRGSAEARVALLPIVTGFNTPAVRAAVRAGVADPNPQVRSAGVRALCDTSDPELLPDLLKAACTEKEETLRTLAVAGCVRLTTQEENVKLPNARRLETLKAILDAGPSAEQKRLVLAGLAEVPSPDALKLAETMLAEPAVQTEAARAIIKLAPVLSDSSAVDAALKQVLAVVQDGPTRQAAEAVLTRNETGSGGFIKAWQITGPYLQAGKDYAALFDVVFPPETSEPQRTTWKYVLAGANPDEPGVVDLLKAIGGQERVAYARTWVYSGRRQPARLELGSDDGVKVWLNENLIFAHNVARPVHPGSDKADLTLNAGWNRLLLKVTQHNQGWGFCARLLQPDGSPLVGVRADAHPPATENSAVQPAATPAPAPRAAAPDGSFKKIQISKEFWSEGANIGDFNRDGQMDVVSGPFWYEGPDFKVRHEIWPATNSFKLKQNDGSERVLAGFEGALGVKNAYSECFFAFTYDFNQDGWPDVLVIGFPGKEAFWYENPKGAGGWWPRHQVFDEVGDESPAFADITGDGKPEILCCARGCMGYLEAEWNHPEAPWAFHPVTPNTPKGKYQKFTHGLGYGDINGDGRVDIIEKDGWWEQPASRAGDPVWVYHPFHFAEAGAQMLVYDVNGDGLNDVITCLNAHGYGLAWYEQVRTNNDITFRQHLILNPDATPNREGISFTQLHGLALADMNGDGLLDIVTGKRFWAHGKDGKDPESDGFPALLYWFELKRTGAGQAEFIPHLVDSDSGVGTQVTVGTIQKGSLPGIVVGNKKGTFVFLRQPVSPAQANAASK